MRNRLRALTLLALLGSANQAMAADENLLDQAKAYIGKGEAKAAVIELKNFLQKNPDHAEARLLLGETYLSLGDGANAARAFEKAQELGAPKDKWIVPLGRAYLLQNDTKTLLDKLKADDSLQPPLRAQVEGIRGSAYLVKNDLAKAKESFNAAIQMDPAASEALLGMALLEAQQKHFKEAVDYATRVVAKNDKNANAWIIIGEAKRLDNDIPGAVDAFGKALQIQPYDVRARLGRATANLSQNKIDDAAKDVAEIRKAAGDVPMALYLDAVIDFQNGRIQEAEDLLVKASNSMPDHLPSKLLLGTIAFQQGEYEAAEKELSLFIAKVPAHLPAIKLLGATRLKLGRAKEAVQVLKTGEPLAKDDVQLLSLLGSAYQQAKEFELSNEYLNRAAQLDPKAASIKAQLGLGQVAAGNLDQGITDLKAAVNLDPNLLQADMMLTLALIQQKKFDEAIAAANALKNKLKDDPMPLNLLGAAYLAKDDQAKAEEQWKAALKLKPDYTPAALNLAKLEQIRNNPEGAVKQFQQMLERDPKNLSALIGLAQIEEGKKNYDKMEAYLIQARDSNPKSPQPALILSRLYVQQGRPLRALEVARDAVNSNPNDVQVMQNLGMVQIANDQAPSAAGTFRKLMNQAPDNPDFRHQYAQALFKAGDKATAAQEWRNLIKDKPEYWSAYLALAEYDILEGKFDDALKLAGEIKAKQPKSSVGAQLEGDIEFAQKQYQKALAAYEQASKVNSSSALARRIYQCNRILKNDKAAFDGLAQWVQANPKDLESLLMIAMGYQDVGKPKEAVDAYEKALALKADNLVVQNNLAWLYQEQGDKRALPMAEKLLTVSENNPEVMDTVGWIYMQNGRVDKALALLQDAAVHAPQQTQIRLHVAEALVKAGRKDEARKEVERLLNEHKEFPERKQAEELLKSL
jgi:putative PEP-CTERM system TPR-repeat lipoprotein